MSPHTGPHTRQTSTMRAATLCVGICFAAAKAALIIVELCSHQNLIPPDIQATLAMGTVVSWMGYFAAYNRDSILTAIANLAAQVANLDSKVSAMTEGEQRAIDAENDALRALTRAGIVNARSRGHIGVVD